MKNKSASNKGNYFFFSISLYPAATPSLRHCWWRFDVYCVCMHVRLYGSDAETHTMATAEIVTT
jgi:hypothetical protein